MMATLRVINLADVKMKAPPTCDACGRQMWWHGSTEGYGCPDMHGGSPGCRSSLYRPKRNPSEVWHPENRYPELYGDGEK